jgi:hypothetical protein
MRQTRLNNMIGRAGAKLGPSTDTSWWRRSVWTGPEIGRRAAEILRWLAESRAWSGQCVEQASSEAVVVHEAELWHALS